ncbi:MAG TPA: hypothetical protein VMV13_05285 [Candidatus Binataceae bacterium]|nr:hypothetical protein [Candidatus Binataceae bacterium]
MAVTDPAQQVTQLNATNRVKFDLAAGTVTADSDVIAAGNSLNDLAAKVAALLVSSGRLVTSDKIAAGAINNVHLGQATLDSVGDGLSRLLFSPFAAVAFPNAIVNTDGTIQVANLISGSISEAQFITSQASYGGTFVFDVEWLSEGILYIAIFASTDTGYLWEFNNLSGAPEVSIYRIDSGTLTNITNNNLSGTQLTGMPGNLSSNLTATWWHCSIEYDATGAMRVHVGAKLMATANDNTYVIGGPLGYGYSGSIECVIANPQISTAADDTPMPDPTALAYSITRHNDIKLTWSFPTPAPREFDHFEIRVNSTNTFVGSTYIDQTRKHQYLIVDPTSGSNYYFVAALNKAGYYDNTPPGVLVSFTQQPYTVKTPLGADVGPITAETVIIGPFNFVVPPSGGRLHVDWTMIYTNGASAQSLRGYVSDNTTPLVCAQHRTHSVASVTSGFNGSGHFDRLYPGGSTISLSLVCIPVGGSNVTVNASDTAGGSSGSGFSSEPSITFMDVQFHPSPN